MNVGTAKPTVIERMGVPHHLIDVVEPEEEFSVAEFRRQGRSVIDRAERPIVITGGSGLHFRALVDPMSFAPTQEELRAELEERDLDSLVTELFTVDDGAARHVDLANKRRVVRAVEIYLLTGETPTARAASAEAEELRKYVPEVGFTAVGIDPGALLEDRIVGRLDQMRSGGLVEEVRGLRGRLGKTARSAVGYRELNDYFDGKLDLRRAFENIAVNTRRLARKQRTWFQRDPRIRWIPWMEEEGERIERAMEILT
jgi:tRNA dimethylallyltransferase